MFGKTGILDLAGVGAVWEKVRLYFLPFMPKQPQGGHWL